MGLSSHRPSGEHLYHTRVKRTRLLFLLLLPFFLPASPASSAVVARPIQSANAGGPGLRFDLGAQEMRDVFLNAQRALDQRLSALAGLSPRKLTFNNTVLELEQASAEWNEAVWPITFLAYVSPDPQVRATAREFEKEISRQFIAMASREDVAAQFKAYAALGKKLGKQEKTLLEMYLYMFRDAGSGLSKEKREKLGRLQRRLTELEINFDQNLVEHKDELVVTRDELEGLPASYVEGLQKTSDGRYLVGLDYPSYYPFMRQAKNADLRRRLLAKFENRAADKNVPALREMLKLRREAAKILGHENHAEFAVTYRIAAVDEIRKFLGRIRRVVGGQAREELAALLELKRRDDPTAKRVERWDKPYYENKLKEERFQVDLQEASSYFQTDNVVKNTMALYSDLLGIAFEETPAEGAWHPEVRAFAISDAKSGRRLGWLYLDLYPRDGKYNHAAEFSIVSARRREHEGYREPVAAIVTNFPRATPGSPSLLDFENVETFVHEFGHAMHETLTKAKYASFAGTGVRLDFVEMPSQAFENFIWDKSVIQRLSGHYEDPSRKLPDELFEKVRAARRVAFGLNYLERVAKSAIDLAYHVAVPHDTTKTYQRIWESISPIPFMPGTHPEASFGHLVGYDAGYYSYLWAEAYARDVLTHFVEKGYLSKSVGRRLRREILEKGGSDFEPNLLKKFLGRDTDDKAFFEFLRGRGPQA